MIPWVVVIADDMLMKAGKRTYTSLNERPLMSIAKPTLDEAEAELRRRGALGPGWRAVLVTRT